MISEWTREQMRMALYHLMDVILFVPRWFVANWRMHASFNKPAEIMDDEHWGWFITRQYPDGTWREGQYKRATESSENRLYRLVRQGYVASWHSLWSVSWGVHGWDEPYYSTTFTWHPPCFAYKGRTSRPSWYENWKDFVWCYEREPSAAELRALVESEDTNAQE